MSKFKITAKEKALILRHRACAGDDVAIEVLKASDVLKDAASNINETVDDYLSTFHLPKGDKSGKAKAFNKKLQTVRKILDDGTDKLTKLADDYEEYSYELQENK